MTDVRLHWTQAWEGRPPEAMSWYQRVPQPSLELVQAFGPRHEPLIDVGGGASTLTDALLDDGYEHVTVLDISAPALASLQDRLASRASQVQTLAADVLSYPFDAGQFWLWHDRAVFHFLNTEIERATYLSQLKHAVRPGGYVIMGTFADDGPDKCSGLPVRRYSCAALLGRARRTVDRRSTAQTRAHHAGRQGSVLQFCGRAARQSRAAGVMWVVAPLMREPEAYGRWRTDPARRNDARKVSGQRVRAISYFDRLTTPSDGGATSIHAHE